MIKRWDFIIFVPSDVGNLSERKGRRESARFDMEFEKQRERRTRAVAA